MRTLLIFAALCVAVKAVDILPENNGTSGTLIIAAASAPRGKIIVLPNATGDWIPVTTQEAQDVVRAMEILDGASRPTISQGFVSSYSNDLVYRPMGFSAGEKAAMAREEAAYYEAKAKAEAEQYERVQWARSILELWKKKCEGAK